MIASLRGEVLACGKDFLEIFIGGIGLQVFVVNSLTNQKKPGDKIDLFTYLVVREDALTLFGFETREEKEFFELLISVNGVGPRTALSALSTLSVDAIRRAVVNEQPEVFSRVPGVGKKGAQKILLHLQDKVGEIKLGEGIGLMNNDTEVIEALTGLGYSIVEAQAALQSIPRDAPDDIEERIILALKYFSG